MSKKFFRFTSILSMLCVFAGIVFGQEKEPSQVALQVAGLVNTDSTGKGITVHATHSGGLRLSYTRRINKWAAFEIGYGYTRDTQNYLVNGLVSSSVQTTFNQYSLSFVYRIPLHIANVHPYALAGTGAVQFRPTSAASNPGTVGPQNNGTLLYGGGLDVDVTPRLGVKLDYRGLHYDAPNFSVPALSNGATTHLAEPSVGVFYRF